MKERMCLPTVSVIVTTYNWPAALDQVLAGLAAQRYTALEIIIADDGSRADTKALIDEWRTRMPFPLKHCWQPDEGFRAAQIRNKAVAMATHEYIIFIDGDCVPFPHFVHRHAQLAEQGKLVSGNRLLLSQAFTQQLLSTPITQRLHERTLGQWLCTRLMGGCNHWLSLLPLPLGALRNQARHRWQGVKTCNLGVWKEDFLRVNGFDEDFKGWGFEDSDLVIRLFRAGVQRKQGKFAVTVLHLWHKEQDRSQINANQALLDQTLNSPHLRSRLGIAQYMSVEA